MKNFKSIMKTFLFSALTVIVISVNESTIIVGENIIETAVSVCSEEYPNTTSIDSGH